MKGKQIIATVLGIGMCISAAGCGKEAPPHVHEYQYYTVKTETCTEKGLLEMVCKGCGEKQYQDVQPKGHSFVMGECTVCGYRENEVVDKPTNTDVFYSIEDLYQEMSLLRYTMTQEEFIYALSNCQISNIYINKSGRLKLTYKDLGVATSYMLDLGDIRRDFYYPTTQTGIVGQLYIQWGLFRVTDTMGTQTTIGDINATSLAWKRITGIAVNMQNQLFVCYEDGTVRCLGGLSQNQTENVSSTLVYWAYKEGYAISGPMDQGIKEVMIPVSHLGKPITGISINAFSACKNLQKVTFMEGLEIINGYAFENCTALKEVYIPASMKEIRVAAFVDCTGLERVRFGGTQAQWETLDIEGGNEALTNAQILFEQR